MKERISRATGWVVDTIIIAFCLLLWFGGLAVLVAGRADSAECHTYDSVFAYYSDLASIAPTMGEPVELSGPEKAAAIEGAVAMGVSDAERATRVFRAPSHFGPGIFAYGLEVDGCLLDPIFGMEFDPDSIAPSPSMDSSAVNA